MKYRTCLVVGSAVLLLLGGCGGDDSSSSADRESAPPSSTVPATKTVTVRMHDALPLDALYNGDGVSCITYQPVAITLKDATGTIVGNQDVPSSGGSFDKRDGCSWDITFNGVAASDFYQATVDATSQTYDGTGQADGGIAIVEVDM